MGVSVVSGQCQWGGGRRLNARNGLGARRLRTANGERLEAKSPDSRYESSEKTEYEIEDEYECDWGARRDYGQPEMSSKTTPDAKR